MCRAYNLVLTVHNSVFFQLVYSRKGYLLNEKSEFSKYASSKLYKCLSLAHIVVCVWQQQQRGRQFSAAQRISECRRQSHAARRHSSMKLSNVFRVLYIGTQLTLFYHFKMLKLGKVFTKSIKKYFLIFFIKDFSNSCI